MRSLAGDLGGKNIGFFVLFYILLTIVFTFVDVMTGLFDPVAAIGLFSGVFALAMLIPALAVSVRRLHDTDRSGWWFLINFIPLIGAIVFLVFTVQDSKPGENQYGSNPKDMAA